MFQCTAAGVHTGHEAIVLDGGGGYEQLMHELTPRRHETHIIVIKSLPISLQMRGNTL